MSTNTAADGYTLLGVNKIQAGFFAERGLIHVWATGAQLNPAQARIWAAALADAADAVEQKAAS